MPVLRGAALGDLVTAHERLEGTMWSASTQRSMVDVKSKMVAFNRQHYPSHQASVEGWPCFVSAQVETSAGSGPPQYMSASINARLFFTQFSELAKSTLAGYRWQIQQIYAHHHYGPVPWDVSSGQAEAARTNRFINRLIHIAEPPQPHTPLDHIVFAKVLRFWAYGGYGDERQPKPSRHSSKPHRAPISTLAMAAAACFLRGTAGRSQDLVRLRYEYVQDRTDDGFDFNYPERDPVTQAPFTRKGHRSAESRRLVMPEKLDDGCHIAFIFRNYLVWAPKEGPLFQKTTPGGTWSGKAWSASDITDKLRKALADPSVGLSWSKDQIRRFSAHSFRSGAATEMASGQVSATMVAKALHHHESSVTSRSYINPTDSHIRQNLSVTGTQPSRPRSHFGSLL
jgi:integrase